jgi:hypothetical protein
MKRRRGRDETLRFLTQQLKELKELGGPPIRLHEHLLNDKQGRPTSKRKVVLNGGLLDGGQDDLRCGDCQEMIAQTVLEMGVPVPAGSTAFEVGAYELFKVARDRHRLRVTHETYFHRKAKKEFDTQRIDDLLPIMRAWFKRLETQVRGDRPESPAAPAAHLSRRKTPPPDQRGLNELNLARADGWVNTPEAARQAVNEIKSVNRGHGRGLPDACRGHS